MPLDCPSPDRVDDQPVVFPPHGWINRHQAAARLGVVPLTLKRYVDEGKVARGQSFTGPNGRPTLLYRVEDLDRAKAAMAAAAAAFALPEGFVDRDGACVMFSVTQVTWGRWEREGRVAQGEWGRNRHNQPCRIYRVAELERAMAAMRPADRAHRLPGKRAAYHVPDGFAGLRAAARLFGVEYATFHRWELEGRIACGFRVDGTGPKVYPVEALERLVAECGVYSPPYPDPARTGVMRVPLAGRGMKRREAIIDATDVHLIEGMRCHWSDRGQPGKPGDVSIWKDGEQLRLRQLILGVRGVDARVGHRNGDPLDCRRENLFVRTKQEQQRGNGKMKGYGGRPCTSRFKGVCWDKQTAKWRAGIVVDGRAIRLGRHADEIAAAQAYDEAARKHFGEYANVNFPDGVDARLEREAMEAERAAASDDSHRIAA